MTLIDVLKGYLRLSTADHALFGQIQADLPEVVRAVDYLRTRPVLLQESGQAEYGQLERTLSERWGCPHLSRTILASLNVAPAQCPPTRASGAEPTQASGAEPTAPTPAVQDAVTPKAQASSPAPQAQQEQQGAAPTMPSASAQHLHRLLAAGMTLPEIARQINDQGGSVSRRQLKRAQRDAETLPETDLQLLLNIGPATDDMTDLRTDLQAAAAQLDLGARGLAQVIREAHTAQATAATQIAVLTLERLGEQRLECLLSAEGEIDPAERETVCLLIKVLQEIQVAKTFITQLQRVQALGWTPTTLTPSLRRLGWSGEAIDQFQLTDLDQVRRLTQVLTQVTAGPELSNTNVACDQDVAFPLTTTAERERYVNGLLDANGTVCANDLTAAFGMRGVAISSFLRDTMKLQGIGHANYRRKR